MVQEIPMLEDNYGYLLIDEATKEAAAIDAVEADTVLGAHLLRRDEREGGQAEGSVFTGDTLFIGRAGKFFEGSPQDMQSSLSKLAFLPPETSVYCGHEYTLQNYKFAQSMEPNNAELAAAVDKAKARRTQGLPTFPSTIAKELATNPFMRVLNPAIQERVAAEAGVALEDLDPSTVLRKVREMKSNFR